MSGTSSSSIFNQARNVRALSESVLTDDDFIIFPGTMVGNEDSALRFATKIPPEFLRNLLLICSTGGNHMFSSRSDISLVDLKFAAQTAQYRAAISKRSIHTPLNVLLQDSGVTNAPALDGKDGGVKSKSSTKDSIVSGNIPFSNRHIDKRNIESAKASDSEFIRGYNLLDHATTSNFATGSKAMPKVLEDQMKLAFIESDHANEIYEIRTLGKLITFAVHIKPYIKEEDIAASQQTGKKVYKFLEQTSAETNANHFIQRTELLYSILKNIARGIYINPSIEQGYLVFQHYSNNKKDGIKFKIKLADIVPTPSEPKFTNDLRTTLEKLKNHLPGNRENLTFENIVTMSQIICENLKDHNLFQLHCPIWEKPAPDKKDIPLMVRCGQHGYAIGGDVDMLQIPAPFDLPAWVHKNYATSKREPNIILATFLELKQRVLEEISLNESSSELAKIFINNIKDALAYYRSNPKQLQNLNIMGTTNIYSFVMQYYFNHKLAPNPNHCLMWLHAPETGNPGAEAFESSFAAWKGNFYFLANEPAYLHFLLHDPDILANEPLSFNAAWLPREGACTTMWQDIIRIQAYRCIQISPNMLHDYFEYLLLSANHPEWLQGTMADKRVIALEIINNIKTEVQAERSKPGFSASKVVKSLYNKYEASCAKIRSEGQKLSSTAARPANRMGV